MGDRRVDSKVVAKDARWVASTADWKVFLTAAWMDARTAAVKVGKSAVLTVASRAEYLAAHWAETRDSSLVGDLVVSKDESWAE